MKHPHAELIKQWVDDTSLVIETSTDIDVDWQEVPTPFLLLYPNRKYRIKPAKPKKVKLLAYLGSGELRWFNNPPSNPEFIRVPELDKEVKLP